MADPSTSKPDIQMIPTDKLIPNPWNPNEMSVEAFQEYVAEVQRLGQIPKPVIVRPREDQYEIVDGEHAWRAAQEVGLTEVPCEVLDINSFEAMRQSYRRNRGGTDNPLLLGQMFAQMLKARKLSIRKFATEIELAEGTVRNHLDYVRAFKQRSATAPETARKDIENLSQREVRQYHQLPEAIRDLWLDAGACVIDLDQVCKDRVYETGDAIVDAGLADLLDAATPGKFRDSFERAMALSNWREEHSGIPQINAYLRPVAEGRLPAKLLNELPCATANGSTKVYVSPEEWATILKNASAHSTTAAELELAVESGVRCALGEKNVDVAEVYGPQVAELLQSVEEAPPSIREADWLTLEEKCRLATLEVDATEEVILRAKELACELLQCQRAGGKARRRGGSAIDSIDQAFFECLQRVQEEQALAEENALFADLDALQETVLARLIETEAVREGVIDGQPAAEVLAKRLDALDWPEYFVLATCILHTDRVELAAGRWLKAVADQVPQEADNDDDSEGVVEKTEPEEENDYEEENESYEEDEDEEDSEYQEEEDEEQQDD